MAWRGDLKSGIPDLDEEDDDAGDNPYEALKRKKERDAESAAAGEDAEDGGENKQAGGEGGEDDEWNGRTKKDNGENEEWIDPDAEEGWGGGGGGGSKDKFARPNFDDDPDDEVDLTTQFKTFGKRDAEEMAEERRANEILKSGADLAAEAEMRRQLEREAEKLGDDFEDSAWVPPSINKALDFRAHTIFRGGSAPINSTVLCNASDLSLAAALHFQFLYSMSVMSFVMFWLSLPALIFAFAGKRISSVDQDKLGLYQLTLGNVGYDPSSRTFVDDARCNKLPANYNGTCLHLSTFVEVPVEIAASVLTAMEFLQCIVFIITVWHLRRKTNALKKTFLRVESTVSNFSVFVDHLPEDTTIEQLVAHFTNLYPLDTKDWRGRPPVVGAEKVQSCENSGNAVHINTWVAECTLHKRVGKLIRRFKNMTRLTERLRGLRARIKMYSDDTSYEYGPKPRKRLDHVEKYVEVAHRIDKIAAKLRKRHFKLAEPDPEFGFSDRTPFMERIEAPVVCGFVVFQYSESMARCVEDYAAFSTFPRVLCYPSRLKFRGHRIRVHHAPQPDSIIWENLEVPKTVKRFKRARTVILAIIAVVVAFVIDLEAVKYKNNLTKSTPQDFYCQSDIPQLYSQNSSSISAGQFINVGLIRPALAADRTSLDAQCAALVPGTFYGTYSFTGKGRVSPAGDVVGKYDLNACTESTAAAAGLAYYGLCPHEGQRVFCPCASLTSTEQCHTAACATHPTSSACYPFPASSMGSCMCFNGLQKRLDSLSGSNTLAQLEAFKTDICGSFFINYTTALALNYVAALASVIIALCLRWVLSVLTVAENHNSLDGSEGSKMSKLFISNYATLCIIILIAYGKIEGLPSFVADTLGIFSGPYADFTSGWYGNVGNFLVVSFLLKVLASYAADIYKLHFAQRLTRVINTVSIESHRNSSYVCQDEVNALFAGKQFDVSDRTATLLVLVFYFMTFAPGLPVLVPLACLTFVINFRIQKRLLLRFNAKPDHMDDKIMRAVLAILPYAAVIRLGFAAWMLGNPDVFAKSLFPASASGAGAGSVTASSGLPSASVGGVSTGGVSAGSLSSMLQQNAEGKASNYLYMAMVVRAANSDVVPLIALLVLVVIGIFLQTFWKELPLYWLGRVAGMLCQKKNKVYVTNTEGEGEEAKEVTFEALNGFDLVFKADDPLRLDAAPFTGPYYKYLSDLQAPRSCFKAVAECFCPFCLSNPEELSDLDIQNGWEVADQGDRYMIKIKTWPKTGVLLGAMHTKGAPKRTYEMIMDNNVATYNIELVPSYRQVMESVRDVCLNEDQGPYVSMVESYKARVKENFLKKRAARLDKDVWEQDDVDPDDTDKYFASIKDSKSRKEGTRLHDHEVAYDDFEDNDHATDAKWAGGDEDYYGDY